MGVPKGQNNFLPFQQDKVNRVIRAIESVLRDVPKDVVFKKVSSLTLYVSKDSQINVDRTTLRKNRRYLAIILNYFIAQPGSAGIIHDAEATRAIARVKGLSSSAELQNLEKENKMLKSLTKRLQKSITTNEPPDRLDELGTEGKSPADMKFAMTSKALFLLLDRLRSNDLGIILDAESGNIIDITESGDEKVIVNAEQLTHFVDWMRRYSKSVLANVSN